MNTENFPKIIEAELPPDVQQKLAEILELFNLNVVCAWTEQLQNEVRVAPLAKRLSAARLAGGTLWIEERHEFPSHRNNRGRVQADTT